MRKLFLLCSLAFAVYYGASLWSFTDMASMKVATNWLPLGLLVLFFLLGLIHIRFALGAGMALIILLGNPPVLNELAIKVLKLGDGAAVFGQFGHPIESILLGLFAAWALLRMFGNPELDYEYNRARAVRSLHFAVFIVGFTAVLAALHSVVLAANVWSSSFEAGVREALTKHPFGFLSGQGGLAPLRAVILLLEGIAVYTIVTNEVRTPRQVRGFMWLLLAAGLLASLIAFAQSAYELSYGSGLWRYNQEVHGTFADPNSFAVFLMALLPFCAAMIINGAFGGLIGLVMTVVLLTAIVKSDTKLAIFASLIFLVVVAVTVLARAVKRSQIYPFVLTAVLVIVLLGGYVTARVAAKRDPAPKWASAVVKKVDGTMAAFVKGSWDQKSLNQRTNYKLGDILTALNMVNPKTEDGAKNLLCGVGYGRFTAEYDRYRSAAASSRGREGASNMVLQVLAEQGFFGALALTLIIVFSAAWAWCAARQIDYPVFGKAVVWSLLMLVIGCMTENAFLRQQIQAVFWMLAGLCMVQVSVAAKEQTARGGALIKTLIFLLIVAAWAYVMYPVLMTQREEYRSLQQVAADGAGRYKIEQSDLLAALEKTRDYGFNRKGPDRWSEKSALAMTKIEGPVMAFMLSCAHPEASVTNQVLAALRIDGILVTNAVFNETFTRQSYEVDLSKHPKLSALVDAQATVLVNVQVNRTWVPAEVYPQYKDDTFDVGVALSPITWKNELSPPAPEPPAAGDEAAGEEPAAVPAEADEPGEPGEPEAPAMPGA